MVISIPIWQGPLESGCAAINLKKKFWKTVLVKKNVEKVLTKKSSETYF